jgi:hypothetical protein
VPPRTKRPKVKRKVPQPARWSKIAPGDVPARVKSAAVAVLHIGIFAPSSTDLVLLYHDNDGALVGWVDANEIDYSQPGARYWIDLQERMKRPPGAPLRQGYYLFVNGRLIAYQSGLIDFARDKRSIGVGIVAGLVGLFTESRTVMESAGIAIGAQAAHRVISAFSAARSRYAERQKQRAAPKAPPPPPSPTVDELVVAYQTLGIHPFSTHDEAKARFRTLAKEWHPDRFHHDPTKTAEAHIRMSQINVAYSLVCEAHGWK